MSVWGTFTRKQGFSLIESLIVVLILGVLILVAAPSYLGQTTKGKDAAAEQYLGLAYKAARLSAPGSSQFQGVNGTLAGARQMATTIRAAQVAPFSSVVGGERLRTGGGSQTVSGGPADIVVDAASTPNRLILYDSAQKLQGVGTVRECTLTADVAGPEAAPSVSCLDYTP